MPYRFQESAKDRAIRGCSNVLRFHIYHPSAQSDEAHTENAMTVRLRLYAIRLTHADDTRARRAAPSTNTMPKHDSITPIPPMPCSNLHNKTLASELKAGCDYCMCNRLRPTGDAP